MIQKLKIILIICLLNLAWSQDCCEEADTATDNCGGLGCYIPQCTADCTWEPMQCWSSTGYCWCVDENGIEIEGTSTPSWQGFPDCEEHLEECYLTTDDILGPYFFEGAPLRTVIADPDEPGERLFISGRILQNDCESPISGAMLEVWHPNDAGCYSIVEDCSTGNPANDYYNLRGKMFSDSNGEYNFETILPGYYEPRPRHIHIKITTPNEEILISQLYFDGDPFCETDFSCQDAEDRILVLQEDTFGLHGEMEFIMSSSSNGVILGDINFDNLINVQDIILLVGMILNDFNPSDFQIYSGDVNNDNNIDVLDIIQLVGIIIN